MDGNSSLQIPTMSSWSTLPLESHLASGRMVSLITTQLYTNYTCHLASHPSSPFISFLSEESCLDHVQIRTDQKLLRHSFQPRFRSLRIRLQKSADSRASQRSAQCKDAAPSEAPKGLESKSAVAKERSDLVSNFNSMSVADEHSYE